MPSAFKTHLVMDIHWPDESSVGLYFGMYPPPPYNINEMVCFQRCLRARPRMSWSSSITKNAICLKRDDYLIPRKNRWKQFIHHTGSNKSIRREKPNLEDDMAPDPKIENTQNQNAKPAETFIRMMLSETFNLDSVPNTLNSWPARRNARSSLNKPYTSKITIILCHNNTMQTRG